MTKVNMTATPTITPSNINTACMQEPEDTTRINTKDEYEILFWTNRFSITRDRLRDAIMEVGPSVRAVRNYLFGNRYSY